MNREIIWTTQFKKDYKLAIKRHINIHLLDDVIRTLARGDTLPDKFKDHPLSGNWIGFRECHLQPDWILIYHIDNNLLILTLSRTGSHHDLFGK